MQRDCKETADGVVDRLWEAFEIWFDGGVLAKERGGADVARITAFGNVIKEQYGHPLRTVPGKGSEYGIGLDESVMVDRVVILFCSLWLRRRILFN